MKRHIPFIITALFISQSALTAEFCVTTSSQLYAALTTAQSNNQHDRIKIAEGHYISTGAHFTYTESVGWDLEVSGGWTEFFGNACGQQLSGSPWNTVLDGNSTSRIMNITSGGSSDIVISNLTFINGGYSSLSSGGGLRFWSTNTTAHTGQVIIERNVFINNHAEKDSALTFFSSGPKSYIRNNIFTVNKAHNGNYAIELNHDLNSGIYFTNNTVYGNSGDDINGFGGLRIITAAGSETLVANNILYDNGNRDLTLSGSGEVYLKTNNLDKFFGITPLESINNISVPPQFVPGLFSYTPAGYSQLLNRGTHPCTGACIFPRPFDENWILGAVDAQGDVRIQHGTVDIGAVESPYQSELIFINGFE